MKYHLYNININDDFRSGVYYNSVQVFLGGFVREAEKYGEIVLYGSSSSRKTNRFSKLVHRVFDRIFLFRALLNRLINTKSHEREHVFVVLGYDLLNIVQLLVLKFLGFKVLCYVFDSHKLNVKTVLGKAYLVDYYYRLGFFLAKWVDAVICVNNAFPEAYGRDFNRIIKSKVGYTPGAVSKAAFLRKRYAGKCLNIVFGGTLNNDNGSDIVLDVLRRNLPVNICFKVYGGGPFSDEFIRVSREKDCVKFFGVIDNLSVLEIVRGADLCINLRDPASENKELAFPSKLVEYLFNSGSVMSNIFPALDASMMGSFVRVCEFSADSLYEQLVGFCECNRGDGEARVAEFVEFARQEYSWENVFFSLHEDVCKLFK